ncbi:MAG: hypothetical protein AVDCRST_MAG64-3447, partial [uncultured Phycisphaerae bacterium]
ALYREGRVIDTVNPTRVTAEDVMHRLTGADDVPAAVG